MARSFQSHLDKALRCIDQAKCDLALTNGAMSDDEVKALLDLIATVHALRDDYIRHLFYVRHVANKDLAKKFDLTPARISQICHVHDKHAVQAHVLK